MYQTGARSSLFPPPASQHALLPSRLILQPLSLSLSLSLSLFLSLPLSLSPSLIHTHPQPRTQSAPPV